MGNIAEDDGTIDPQALAEEAERAKKGFKSDKKAPWDLTTEPKHLPEGVTLLRVLPGVEGMRMPWSVVDQHEIWVPKDLGYRTEKKVAKFTCLHENGQGYCPACDTFLPQVERSQLPGTDGDDGMAARGKPRTFIFFNCIFLKWGNLPEVPEAHQGVRLFKGGRAVWRGTDKVAIGGISALAQSYPTFASVGDNGLVLAFTKTKTGPQAQDVNYAIDVHKVMGTIERNGRKLPGMAEQFMSLAALGNPEQLLEERIDIAKLFRMKTADEVTKLLDTVDILHGQDPRLTRAIEAQGIHQPRFAPASAQRELESENKGRSGGGNDDIPFDIAYGG